MKISRSISDLSMAKSLISFSAAAKQRSEAQVPFSAKRLSTIPVFSTISFASSAGKNSVYSRFLIVFFESLRYRPNDCCRDAHRYYVYFIGGSIDVYSTL